MTLRIAVEPELLHWACERTGRDLNAYLERFPALGAWARREASPTLKQLERFARATSTPIGYLLLRHPPDERVPIPDFRSAANRRATRPSPDLLDTLYLCQQRREWYREALPKKPRVEPLRHSRVSGNPLHRPAWMPAFAGMTVAHQPSWAKPYRDFARSMGDRPAFLAQPFLVLCTESEGNPEC